MKVIDLLNKIANGEEVPKRIYYFNREFYLKENTYFGDTFTLMHYIQEEDLNDEVEIIEEEKKIPEKLDHLIGYDIQQFDDLKEYVEITTNDLFGEVNKVIDTLNQLSDYLKSKGE